MHACTWHVRAVRGCHAGTPPGANQGRTCVRACLPHACTGGMAVRGTFNSGCCVTVLLRLVLRCHVAPSQSPCPRLPTLCAPGAVAAAAHRHGSTWRAGQRCRFCGCRAVLGSREGRSGAGSSRNRRSTGGNHARAMSAGGYLRTVEARHTAAPANAGVSCWVIPSHGVAPLVGRGQSRDPLSAFLYSAQVQPAPYMDGC